MSKFKVGDKVRLIDNMGPYGHLPVGTVGVVAVVKPGGEDDLISFEDDVLPQIGMYAWRFELVQEEKPAPLIDGPGLYVNRDGNNVLIDRQAGENSLEDYPEHTWMDNVGECYKPDGHWLDVEGDHRWDIVAKISSTPEPTKQEEQPLLRQFSSGATRNLDNNKYDYEGFLSPLVIEAFGKYMHSHRLQKDGKMRDSDNWQLGIGFDVYMKSGWRHFFDWWKLHRGLDAASPEDGHKIDKVEALCALMFNVQGYMHELLKEVPNEE